MKFKTPSAEPAGFQLAPMIDIVFLLLIFFIVTWQFSRSEMDLKVSVPTSTEGADSRRTHNEIIVNVRKKGEMVIDGQVLTEDEVLTKLTIIARIYENQPVRLRADANTDPSAHPDPGADAHPDTQGDAHDPHPNTHAELTGAVALSRCRTAKHRLTGCDHDDGVRVLSRGLCRWVSDDE